MAFATPWAWTAAGLGASPVTGWIEVAPATPGPGQTRFRFRRVARLWPLLTVAAFALTIAKYDPPLEFAAVPIGILLVFVAVFMIRPTARVALGMYHEVTANLARDHQRE